MGTTENKKRTNKSLFKRIIFWLHLWLGLTSGLIVFIISVTGCIYVFEKEIRSITEPYQYVKPEQKPFLPPSQLKSLAYQYASHGHADTLNRISRLQYGDKGKAAIASYSVKEKIVSMIYLNPYSGAVLHEKIIEKDFFRIILEGHFYLWLPHQIGQPVVATAVLIFVVMLITGIIMWWPKNLKKANVNKSFKIKWNAKFKRINYDLHNVLGFYVWLVALVIALTGLVWGFKWFSRAVYWVSSGGRVMPERERFFSDTSRAAYASGIPEDQLWEKMKVEYKSGEGSLMFLFPAKVADVISVIYNPEEGTYYKRQMRQFDRFTLKEIEGNGIYSKTFKEASGADKLSRMNYDIHVGAILGLPGKILAFFASFICASLPVTGTLIWLGKKKKTKKAQPVSVIYEQRTIAVPV